MSIVVAGLGSNVAADVIASTFLAVLIGVGAWLRKQLKGLSRMTRDWNGEAAREGISPGTPGVMQRLYIQDKKFEEVMDNLGRQDSTLAEIQHEISYNSGTSIKDAVHRTDDAVKILTDDVRIIKESLEAK